MPLKKKKLVCIEQVNFLPIRNNTTNKGMAKTKFQIKLNFLVNNRAVKDKKKNLLHSGNI